ncbi:MAG: 2-oxo acid dehydrogenase subunit E2, partial [Anaerolineae bacterium]|nr:2-oxo acid dehydrogenase subunit E2 [Anaerolineae bacterium]
EPLFVILTDKANIEIEAPASGILAGVRAQPDDVIPVTEVIAYILEPGELLPAETVAQPTTTIPAEVPTSAASVPELVAAEAARPGPGEGKVRATPVARRLAAELGIDLTKVPGRGPRGRVHKADVLAFAERQPPTVVQPRVAAAPIAPVLHVPLPDARRKEVVTLAGPRKIIADRMAYSAFTAPHITLSLWVDMSEAARLRTRLLEPLLAKTGQRLSFTAILARAVATVLPRHPYLNASLHGEEIFLWDDVHLGVATSVEDYLIVPVIREAQAKNLEEIVAVLGDLVERARARRLTPAEMTGSTFTISNLGMFGIESFTAIINPPESAILAVGRIVDMPVGAEGEIVLRPMMNLTICADHRVVDGAGAARFLAELKATLENPYLLI